jgi:2-dehydropantoate 2-reductase
MAHLRFNVIGAGAIGHLWACFLQKHEHQVRLISRQSRNAKTIHVESPDLKFLSSINYQPIDHWPNSEVILICVKAHQLASLCQTLVSKVETKCPIILMMNGMGLVEIVNQYLPDSPVIHASITHGAFLQDDKLAYTGNGTCLLGNLHSNYSKTQFEPLINTLNTALPEVRWNETHLQAMNLKLIINAIINPVTALKGIRNGLIVEREKLIEEAELLLGDLVPLLPRLLPGFTPSQLRAHIVDIAKKTQSNTSSMLQDVLDNRQTEIDFINGYLLNLASEASIELPHHRQIINRIKALK